MVFGELIGEVREDVFLSGLVGFLSEWVSADVWVRFSRCSWFAD